MISYKSDDNATDERANTEIGDEIIGFGLRRTQVEGKSNLLMRKAIDTCTWGRK